MLGGVQPSRLMSTDLSNPETASPVTQSIGFQPKKAAEPSAAKENGKAKRSQTAKLYHAGKRFMNMKAFIEVTIAIMLYTQ